MKPGELMTGIGQMTEQVSQDTGLEVLKTRFFKDQGRQILRVTINREGGVTLSDCERFSKALSVLLDRHDIIQEKYYLEVESPGI
jgi:ribosome maturation factor RimP